MERFTISLDDNLARDFDAPIAERGVRHGHLNLVSVEVEREQTAEKHEHGHSHGSHPYRHVHLKPRS